MRTPFFTKKATKKSLDELRKIMPVLSEGQQREYVGRSGSFSNTNCLWMAIDYLNTCGNPTVSGAMALARAHYGESFNPATYSGFRPGCLHPASVPREFASTISGVLSENACNGQIVIFNPNALDSWRHLGIAGNHHAAVFRGYDESGNWKIYSPQSGITGTINPDEFRSQQAGWRLKF